ncbi:MAG: acyltransferase family protein [Acidobacteria bacterium]|nr:acyltransferase family protein [Acidobacteriota bacterium]
MESRRPEPDRCLGRTADGRPCRNRAGESGYCRRHAPPPPRAEHPALTAFEHALAEFLAFLRTRLTGEYPTDDFGFDRHLTESAVMPLLRPFFERWWRIHQQGWEHIPARGPCLLVANHSGTLPWDALMVKYGVFEATGRHTRLLAADMAFEMPVVGEIARKMGSTLACDEDATRLLHSGELVGVFPEGYKGVGKRFRERYKLQRFGRGGFVEVALRTGVPIVPVAIVGAEEIYPMLYDLRSLARLFGLPYFPVTPTFPLLGPLGMVPLPSKWIIEYGEPIQTETLGSESANDPMFVFNLTDQVREVIQQTLYKNLMARRNVFF